MTTRAAIFALLAMWGVGTSVDVMAQDPPDDQSVEAASEEGTDQLEPSLTDRVWVRADADDTMPGPMQIFLSDGTLVSDSCWETYRLSQWKMTEDNSVSWDEDGMEINADIVSLTADELVLSLKLVGGAQEQRFVAAAVPYVCPDIPK